MLRAADLPALRAMPADQLDAAGRWDVRLDPAKASLSPSIDGHVLREAPVAALEHGASAGVALLAGWNASEQVPLFLMMNYWTNFATRGDPNGLGLPLWPVYAGRVRRCSPSCRPAPLPPARPAPTGSASWAPSGTRHGCLTAGGASDPTAPRPHRRTCSNRTCRFLRSRRAARLSAWPAGGGVTPTSRSAWPRRGGRPFPLRGRLPS